MVGVIDFHAYPRIGGISPHGIGIAVGYLLGGMLMVRYAQKRGLPSDEVWNMLMRAVIGVIIGARLFYVVGHLDEYFGAGRSPLDILKIWEGGIVFYGGAVGGIVAAIPYMRKHGYPIRTILDMAAPAFPLGLIFGRIGDIIVGDHLGGASTLPFAFRFFPYEVPPNPGAYVAHSFSSEGDFVACFTSGCHQTALYDLFNVLILFPIVLLLARKPRPRGWLIAFTATWYGGARLLTDFARDAEFYGVGPIKLHGTQWFSILLILVGSIYLIRLSRREEADTWTYSPPGEPAEDAAQPATVGAVGAVAAPLPEMPAEHETGGPVASAPEPGEESPATAEPDQRPDGG